MSQLFNTLWQDENGFVVSAELVLVGSMAVMGMVTGLAEVSNNVNGELQDTGAAIGQLDQSYSVTLPGGKVLSYQDSDAR